MRKLSRSGYPRPLTNTLTGIIILLAAYIVVYQLAPLPAPWSDLFLVYSIVVAALLAAIYSTAVWRSFQVQDRPRQVWKYFALGWCLWAVSELIWSIYYLFDPEVPAFSLSDPFWIAAYALFGAAFLFQFRLVSPLSRQKEIRLVTLAAVLTLLLTLGGTVLLMRFGPNGELTFWETFVAAFYAVSDLGLVIAAIGLARIFGRGLWGQAWLGLLVFALSDSLYLWTTFTGLYAYSLGTSNLITLAADMSYLLAYLLIALACQMHFLLIRYGPTLRPTSSEEPAG